MVALLAIDKGNWSPQHLHGNVGIGCYKRGRSYILLSSIQTRVPAMFTIGYVWEETPDECRQQGTKSGKIQFRF